MGYNRAGTMKKERFISVSESGREGVEEGHLRQSKRRKSVLSWLQTACWQGEGGLNTWNICFGFPFSIDLDLV